MSDDQAYGAMPKLYGAPAYARPRGAGVETGHRPFDPDDLPLECARTELDNELVAELAVDAYTTGSMPSPMPMMQAAEPAAPGHGASSSKRPFSLRLPGRPRSERKA